MACLGESSVFVSGGSGFLGRVLIRHLLKELPAASQPYKVVCYSRRWQEQAELRREINDDRLRLFIGDVQDEDRLDTALRGVDYIVHAASFKDILAGEYNPTEIIRNNILGTQALLNAAIRSSVQRVLIISTDKAVQASSTYGKSKALCESLSIAFQSYAPQKTICVARYGNVASSSGSVIPLFFKCLEDGVPLPITDLSMTRFWITPRQAVDFVVKCLLDGKRGEILVPKLKSCSIEQLADAIDLNHPKVITGRRPGEKMHEVLVGHEEGFHTTDIEWAYNVYPQYHFWDRNYQPRGNSVLPGFVFASSTAEQMSLGEIKSMIEEVRQYVGRKA